ncbi:kinase-like domain-containing protein [Gigaspora rosea]|uniref:Kinase-like domain-containing protein n=1 Tax=Gigaspora rosea TaxID=44941 RepID=A0A397U591_9GLOM|nr:kinase-like domain-containing protein [Gigaspora rosea]
MDDLEGFFLVDIVGIGLIRDLQNLIRRIADGGFGKVFKAVWPITMEENRDSWDEERDICERLQSIHESNYCHKDFHTGNILCDNRDRDEYVLVWISDFGLCRPVDESPNPVGETNIYANGVREIRVEDTPDRYGYLFEDCWKFDPKNRPNINQVVDTLKEIQIKESEKEFKNVKMTFKQLIDSVFPSGPPAGKKYANIWIDTDIETVDFNDIF